jgi:hypothetical protein
MIVNGAMAGGSLGWGIVAGALSVPATLLVSACGLFVVAFILHRIKLPAGEADLKPSNYWPEPLTADTVEHDRGPVLVLIEYRIARDDRPKFLECLKRLSQARRRDGAYGWGITEDAADSERIVEWFMVESWAEHCASIIAYPMPMRISSEKQPSFTSVQILRSYVTSWRWNWSILARRLGRAYAGGKSACLCIRTFRLSSRCDKSPRILPFGKTWRAKDAIEF